MEILNNNKKATVILELIDNILYYQPANVQRLLSYQHVHNLVEDQITEYETNKCFSILQSITCADFNNRRYILDGQHRIACFKLLKQNGYTLHQSIPVVIYTVDSIEEMRNYYVRINNHNPVNPLELTDNWVESGKGFCLWIKDEFGSYVKDDPNKRFNCPHIDMSALKGYLDRMKVFDRLKNMMYEDDVLSLFRSKILEINSFIAKNIDEITKFQFTSEFKKKLDKCKNKNKFKTCYLGVWRNFEWIEISLDLMLHSNGMNMVYLSSFNSERKKIPKSRQYEVWRKRNGTNMEGCCFVCNESLNFSDMECGHIIPNVYNGSTELDNLEPICKTCNRDMGIMNLNEYKTLLHNN